MAAEPQRAYLWLPVPLLRGRVCFSVYHSFGYQHVRMLQFGLLDGQSQGLVEKSNKVRNHRILNTGEIGETDKPLHVQLWKLRPREGQWSRSSRESPELRASGSFRLLFYVPFFGVHLGLLVWIGSA